MGEKTKISWCDHSFNIWWGCSKIGPACRSCYAERDSKRYGLELWGEDAPRRFFGEKYWHNPLRWDRAARVAGVRRKVFCSSMADVFERHVAVPMFQRMQLEREHLWVLIMATPSLDWLLLTKRPENIPVMVPSDWLLNPPRNVWYGVTAEDQEWADRQIPMLQCVPATRRFISVEPMLGPVNLRRFFRHSFFCTAARYAGGPTCCTCPPIDWVICGAESGPAARPMDLKWVHDLRAQCAGSGVAFFMKQMEVDGALTTDPARFPVSLQAQEFPEVARA